ncbi:transcriptional repressor MprA [Ferrovum sp. JA12]|uniref:MarR family winged helix-turn-helix transcriptional regulator n=1 Tax=Ferrovum sp. JA12 TaxID=1356299 RepID=UPI00070258F6|nr:MarR family transcriptional regulator [Ferrovum sp. JA12]KRH79738.1 transcriptional repressor MprA [Ferrovum sp. JA12]
MLLLKELPTSESLKKFTARYPDINITAIVDFLVLLRAGSDISQALDKLLAKYGLLQGRWWILILLLRQPNLCSSPTDLAEKAGVTKASMTGFIDSLQREGFVTRVEDPEDRRKYVIQLTTLGLQKLDSTVPDYNKKVHALMSTLTLEERQDMLQTLKKLVNHLALLG